MHRIEGDGGSQLGIAERRRRRLAADAGEQAAEKLDEPGAPRVDDAGLAQSRQQLGRASERPLALCEGGLEGALRTAVSRRIGAASHLPDDRQHRSLDGHRDRRVGRIAGRGECPSDRGPVEATVARELDGGAPHDLRQDDPGVAASPHQRGAGRGLGLPCRVGGAERRERSGQGLHGPRHVRPRVAIGDGEDVQVVDPAPGRLEGRAGGLDRGEHGGLALCGTHRGPLIVVVISPTGRDRA